MELYYFQNFQSILKLLKVTVGVLRNTKICEPLAKVCYDCTMSSSDLSSNNSVNNQAHLLAKQYRSDKNLANRASLFANYTKKGEHFEEWHPWLYSHLVMPDDGKLLELGCGNASLWKSIFHRIPSGWDITLTDFSEGMLDSAKENLGDMQERFSFQVMDIQDIAIEDHTMDVVVAHHMLYHVPDIDKAISEVHRVLKQAGYFYSATNGDAHMQELIELINKHRAAKDGGYKIPFTLENGESFLSKKFDFTGLAERQTEVLVDAVEPLVAYVMSTEQLMPDDDKLEDFIAEVSEHIAEHGHFRITPSSGLFISRDNQL